jgi:hypothetical protein
MAKRKKRPIISPEQRAEWDAAREQLQARIDLHEAIRREEQAQDERRRRRLQRLSFGLLGRS